MNIFILLVFIAASCIVTPDKNDYRCTRISVKAINNIDGNVICETMSNNVNSDDNDEFVSFINVNDTNFVCINGRLYVNDKLKLCECGKNVSTVHIIDKIVFAYCDDHISQSPYAKRKSAPLEEEE